MLNPLFQWPLLTAIIFCAHSSHRRESKQSWAWHIRWQRRNTQQWSLLALMWEKLQRTHLQTAIQAKGWRTGRCKRVHEREPRTGHLHTQRDKQDEQVPQLLQLLAAFARKADLVARQDKTWNPWPSEVHATFWFWIPSEWNGFNVLICDPSEQQEEENKEWDASHAEHSFNEPQQDHFEGHDLTDGRCQLGRWWRSYGINSLIWTKVDESDQP